MGNFTTIPYVSFVSVVVLNSVSDANFLESKSKKFMGGHLFSMKCMNSG